MNWLDIVLLLIVGSSVFTSLRKGLSREVIGLISVVAALLLGLWFYGLAGYHLLPYVSSRSVANFAGFFLVFVAVLLCGSLIGFLVGKLLKATGLSLFDRAMGAVFGFVRGVLISVALIMGIMAFSQSDGPPPSVVNSRLAPYAVDAGRLISAIAPYELKEGFRKRYAQVKTAWGKALENGIGSLPKTEKEENEKRIRRAGG